jgi:hypothetical protein
MDEQNPNETQPKARRTKSYDAEQPQPSVMGAETEGHENVSEKFSHAGEAGEQVSRATNKEISNVENALPWPFQATQHALDEWTHFFGRATQRNFRATDDLSECHSITSLLQWQGDLIQSNFEDWLQTSFRSLAFLYGSFSHIPASETAATSAS